MRYFENEELNHYLAGEEYEVFFDDVSNEKIGYTSVDRIFDLDGDEYINLEMVEDEQSTYLDMAFEGMDYLIRAELEESEKPYRAWERAKDCLCEQYGNSKIYPFVPYDEFISVLAEFIHDLGAEVWNQHAASESHFDEYEDDEYEDDTYEDDNWEE